MRLLNKKKDYLSFLFLSFLIIFFPQKGFAMGLFDFFKVYQASEFNGVLTKAGEPLSGVTLERKVDENDSYVTTQKTVTDDNGKFSFPSVYRYGLMRFSIAENRFFQKIIFEYQKEKYTAFYKAKSGVVENSEFSFINDKKEVFIPLNFNCDINNDDEGEMYRTSAYTGICRLIK